MILAVVVTGLLVPSVSADENLADSYLHSHQAGARLGGWANQGDTPPETFDLTPEIYYLTDVGDGSFYLEGFYAWRLKASLMAELSLGLVTRGDVTLVEADGGSSLGTVQIYPILAKIKLYPLGAKSSKFFPYFIAGGGVYYGRHSIQIVSGYDAYMRQNFGEDSRTKFTYVMGGGFDWPLASTVALDFQAQYMPIDFSGDLVGVNDYRAWTITVGVKYLMAPKKKKN
jgi:opacity protein-like surface antigen